MQEHKAFIELCTNAYLWVAYLHRVGEGECLAQLLLRKDSVVGARHLGDKQRAAIEASLSRWPINLSQPLCDALAVGVLLHCGAALGEDVSFLGLPGFCPQLKRIDRGQVLVVPTDDALVEMHSLLETQSQQLEGLQPLIQEHDQNLVHLERMQRRLERLA